jgi:hypothetical protein
MAPQLSAPTRSRSRAAGNAVLQAPGCDDVARRALDACGMSFIAARYDEAQHIQLERCALFF